MTLPSFGAPRRRDAKWQRGQPPSMGGYNCSVETPSGSRRRERAGADVGEQVHVLGMGGAPAIPNKLGASF
jgi:hypothetical protein